VIHRAILSVALAVLWAGAAIGECVPPVKIVEPGAGEPTLCQARADTLCSWRDKLGLRDWVLELHCVPPPGFEEIADGLAAISAEERYAEIWLHPDADDPELIVVHELLHIWFTQICEDGGSVLEEQGLRIIARLLKG